MSFKGWFCAGIRSILQKIVLESSEIRKAAVKPKQNRGRTVDLETSYSL
jgi:hypothetical protein